MADPDDDYLAAMRAEYGPGKDGRGDLEVDWLDGGWPALLRAWLSDADRAGISEPNAMVLATVESEGAVAKPVTRSVLCKAIDDTGITFFTSYDSAKGGELATAPWASATFPWYRIGRQFHIRGSVTKADPDISAAYWSKRPRGSQLGAWASQQSRSIASRAALLDQLAEVTALFSGVRDIPVPPNWGGYVIAPQVVEFWQGRENRIHNRIRVIGDRVERLQP